MNLAITVAIYSLTLGFLAQPLAVDCWVRQSQENAPATQSQAPPAQGPELTPTPGVQPQAPPTQEKAASKRRRHKKKPVDCASAPTAVSSTDATSASSANQGSNGGSATAAPGQLLPCPPPKKVIRNGGSSEPTVQLKGGADQELQQRSTEQLSAATTENLTKITGRQLNSSQQEMVSQIKQFMDQSKAAVAAGDLQRGHNLAAKAHLLSDELLKP